MKTIAVLNGPNLNRLGKREPEIYGTTTLSDLEKSLTLDAMKLGFELIPFQSNHEGKLIDKIHELSDAGVRYGMINPGGLTHTSVSLRDAIASCSIKFVEVHISNIQERESFRKISLTADVCVSQICGHGLDGYKMALEFLANLNSTQTK